MKKYGKKILSALLVIAMMASLLVIPAAADDPQVLKTWDIEGADSNIFNNNTTGFEAESTDENAVLDGLRLVGKGRRQSGQGVQLDTNAHFEIPVEGNCQIKVYTNYKLNLYLGDDASKAVNDTNKVVILTYKGAAGTVNLCTANGSNCYITKIELLEYQVAAPALTLTPKDGVVLKMGDTATVTAEVDYATKGTVTVAAQDTTIATAKEEDGAILITPVAAGKTTVEVSVAISDAEDGTSTGPLTATIPVRVLPAEVGTVSENTTYQFTGVSADVRADTYYSEGLEWMTAMGLENGEGPHAKNPTLNVYIPDGKQTTLTIEICGYVGGPAATLTADGKSVDGADNETAEGGKYGKTFTVEGATGKTVLSFASTGGDLFFHKIAVGAFTDADPDAGDKFEAKSWDLDVAAADNITGTLAEPVDYDGLIFTGRFRRQSGHGVQFYTNGAIEIPVPGDCDIKVSTNYKLDVYLEGQEAFNETVGNPVTLYYRGEAGTVKLHSGSDGNCYVTKIELAAPSETVPPALRMDKGQDIVMLKMGETETAQVNVNTRALAQDAVITATSGDAEAVKAEYNKTTGKVDVTALAATEDAVTVTVAVEGTELKDTFQVSVEAAGEVTYYIAEGTYDFTGMSTAAQLAMVKGLDAHGAVPQDATPGHGLQETGSGAGTSGTATGKIELTVNIPEGRTADLIFVTCRYGIGTALLMESTSGEVTKKETSVDQATGLQFTVAGASGETTLTFTVPEGTYTDENGEEKAYNKGIWIHSMSVLFGAVKDEDRKIDIWDLTGQVVTGDKYNNHITPALWKEKGWAVDGVLSNGTEITVGDFTLIHNTNDRLYSSVENAADFGAQTSSYGKWTYDDGYVPNGGIYGNGAGSATARYMQVKNVFPGDKLVAYMGSAQNGDVPFVIEGLGSAAAQEKMTQTAAVSAYVKMEFVAEQSGTYKIWANGGGKPMYQRVVRYPGVPVSGTITLPEGYDGPAEYGIKFVNKTTKAVTLAQVKDNKFNVTLAPGYEYNSIMTGAAGWGFTVATKTVETAEDGGVGVDAGMTHNMSVEAKSTYVFSGSFVGFADGYDISKLAVDLIPEEGAGADDANLTITGKTFTATLDPEVEYTLVMSGVNDYSLKSGSTTVYSDSGDLNKNIEVEAKPLVAASGKFVTLDVDDQYAPLYAKSTYAPLTAEVTALVFENVDDGYTYTATVKDGGYTANLRAGAYLAKATVNGWSTKGHVVVADKAVEKDLMFVSKATPAAVDYAADIYVDGKGGSDLHFKTVTGAMAYIKRMTRSDTQRVTVHIAPGTYREQISIDSKNVTFVNTDPAREVKLTWYYGIGYDYYSAAGGNNLDSWYDAQNAFDKYTTPGMDVARWGCTVRVQAPGFQAQDITFENSFNYYLTEEEVVDGVVPNGAQTIKFAREYGADVTSKAATERAAAIWVDTNSGRGDMTEFKNCKFLSSQDTFGTGSRMYLKDCYIEGMTDFICGPGDCVFDTCTLNWKGYSETAVGGYLTAPQTGASEKGYFFRNCYVSGDTKLKLTGGALGRTWGAANTKCLFLNTTLQSAELINNATWVEMQGFKPENSSTLLEWGTMLVDGTAVDLTKRTLQNTVAKTQPTATPEDYFGGWVPEYYVKETNEGVELTADPTVKDNGDINLLRPGHTLTVAYTLTPASSAANDNSLIQWYRVKDGAETLVKTSTAVAGKTYQVQTEDVGAQIKVTITPRTIGGQTGAAKSLTVNEVVLEGYEDPSGGVDPVLGAGVNIYLAGDSTVKDYSANGMWNSGKLAAEGSWGEWLQQFFNDKVTVVNYAQGGRTTRSFIEQDKSLEKIDATIKEGDFLFIQFGHNDCHTADDRGVPLGIKKNDAQKSYAEGGVYPDTSLEANTYYPAGTKTYTAYLKDYIAVTEKHGATAVLMTPVARLYYTSDGKIRPHHDATAFDGTSDNEYCKAVKWVYDWAVAQGYNVKFMDNYQLTADLFEMAYADGGNDVYGRQLMASGESTHNSKLGGLIEAAVVAQAIQNSDMTIAKAVQAPTQALGKTPTGETAFVVDGSGALTAYDNQKDFAEHATYWEGKGQKMFDDIAAKAAQLGGGTTTPEDPEDPTKPADKTALSAAITAAEKAVPAGIYVVGDDTKVSDVNKGTQFITESDKAAYDKALAAAKAVLAKADATQAEVDAAVAALNAAAGKIQTGSKSTTSGNGGSGSSGRPSGSGSSGSTTTTTTNANGDTVKKTANSQGDTVITVTAPNGEELVKVTLPATVAAATKFVDVPDDHWAAKSINTMAALGMVKGVSADTYDMVSPMTRGAIATVLYRLSNGGSGKTTTFADVAENAWYADAVGWAAATGVVTGYDHTAFGPDDTITRQQLAVMLARYAKLLGLDTTAQLTALDSFTDGSAVGSWAADDMAWCVQKGILKGRGNGVLDPTADVTRAEAAVMLDRMIDLIK